MGEVPKWEVLGGDFIQARLEDIGDDDIESAVWAFVDELHNGPEKLDVPPIPVPGLPSTFTAMVDETPYAMTWISNERQCSLLVFRLEVADDPLEDIGPGWIPFLRHEE